MNKTLLKGNAMTNDKQPDVHPLSGTHINQGSFDAAADAYEAEYNAAHQPVAVDWWVLVPVEPTNAMVEAAELDACGRLLADDIADAYSAMLSAAPTPPSAPVHQSVPPGLIEALRDYQFQIDEDGTNIGVNRQAVDEAVKILTALSTSPSLDKNDQKEGEKVEFLLDGARFKLSFHQDECPHCGEMLDDYIVRPLEQYREELNGQWVALVPAENDRHLKFTAKPPQPPAEAGEGAVAWLATSDDGELHLGFDRQDLYRDVLRIYTMQPLYTSQTTATQAAVAAAMRECAEIAEAYREVTDGQSMYIADKIRSSIPAEATAALRELMEAAEKFEFSVRAELRRMVLEPTGVDKGEKE
jgi:hypothetical protein